MICHHRISSLLKISENGSMNGLHQKARISTGLEPISCVNDERRSYFLKYNTLHKI